MRVGRKIPSEQTLQRRPARKKFEGRGKISAPTREYAGFPLAATVPCILAEVVGGGTFQPALSPPTTSPLPLAPSSGRRPRFRRKQLAGARRKAATRTRPPLSPSPCVGGRRICGSAVLHRGPPDLAFSDRRWLRQVMEWSGSISRSPGKGASPHAGTGSFSRRRRRFAGTDSSGRGTCTCRSLF